jgi:hypothetical protein
LADTKGDKNSMYPNQSYCPKRVRQAVLLLYISIGIGILKAMIEFPDLPLKPGYVVPFIGLMAAVNAIWLFLIYMTGKGKNWARIILLVMLALGSLLMIRHIWQSLTVNPVSGMFNILPTIINIIALVFLLQRESSHWFRQMKANRYPRYYVYKPPQNHRSF